MQQVRKVIKEIRENKGLKEIPVLLVHVVPLENKVLKDLKEILAQQGLKDQKEIQDPKDLRDYKEKKENRESKEYKDQ